MKRSVVSFYGLDGNEKFGAIIIKSIVPAITRQKRIQEYSSNILSMEMATVEL